MSPVWSLGGAKYAILYQDYHSNKHRLYFAKKKSKALAKYKQYKSWAKVQQGVKAIKILGCD